MFKEELIFCAHVKVDDGVEGNKKTYRDGV